VILSGSICVVGHFVRLVRYVASAVVAKRNIISSIAKASVVKMTHSALERAAWRINKEIDEVRI